MSQEAFSLLHKGVQKAIYKSGWAELHDIQVEAIKVLRNGTGHLLICAQTAGGKTEAAFLPIISALAENPQPSVQALYIGPLIALINDQFSRLESLCAEVEVPVHRWHGAASATEKRKLRESPGGILLITPESLESNFINYGAHIRRIYKSLEYIVIDELHSFLSSVRGVHLRSLLARLSAATGCHPRIVGLSATLGDPMGARSFIDPDAPETVHIVHGAGEQAVKFAIKAFLRGKQVEEDETLRCTVDAARDAASSLTNKAAQNVRPLEEFFKSNAVSIPTSTDEMDEIAADILETCTTDTNLVFGNAKQGLEVLADRLHREVKQRGISPDPFHVHHGSLSKDVREETETVLKSGKPATVLCSSTLEMGIDIGSVKRVAQLDPPWSVASMKQRLGRSGRRPGETAIMRLYTRDDSPHAESSLTDLLFPKLLRAVALTRLMLQKWLEPHESNRLELSTLVHQVLSCLRETGGMSAAQLFNVLVTQGAFRNVDKMMFREVLQALGSNQLIEQMPTQELILAPAGERITAEREFYAAFQAADEFIVRDDGREIGKLQSTLIPPVGENLILGGRRWRVDDIHTIAKTVHVSRAKGGKAPVFRGSAGEIHTRVAEEMAATLASVDLAPFLSLDAKTLLIAARETALRSGMLNRGFIERGDSIQWFPWLGTRGILTLELCAFCDGIAVSRDELSITYKHTDKSLLRQHLQKIANQNYSTLELAQRMAVKHFDKFDEILPETLLDKANARDRLDLFSTMQRVSAALAQM